MSMMNLHNSKDIWQESIAAATAAAGVVLIIDIIIGEALSRQKQINNYKKKIIIKIEMEEMLSNASV